MSEHGTVRGYRQHQERGHRGVQIDDECRDAWNAYMAGYMRATYDPAKRRAAYERAKARGYYAKDTA